MHKSECMIVPENPWVCQEFILYKKNFDKKLNEFTLNEKDFDIGLINDYCIMLNNAFSFQIPPSNLDEIIEYSNLRLSYINSNLPTGFNLLLRKS